jgi:hypothetical protein
MSTEKGVPAVLACAIRSSNVAAVVSDSSALFRTRAMFSMESGVP